MRVNFMDLSDELGLGTHLPGNTRRKNPVKQAGNRQRDVQSPAQEQYALDMVSGGKHLARGADGVYSSSNE